MSKYMLILRGDVTAADSSMTPEDMQKVIEAYGQWAGRLAQQGILHVGHKLADRGGKVMRPKSGSVDVTDGPFIESKEVVGGYYVITAESYDHAVELCRGHPNFRFGSIEIRELDFMGGPEEL